MRNLSPLLVIGCHGVYEPNADGTDLKTFKLPLDIIKINASPLGCSNYIQEHDVENSIPFSITNKNNNFQSDEEVINFIQNKIVKLPLILDNHFEKRLNQKQDLHDGTDINNITASGEVFLNKKFQYDPTNKMQDGLIKCSPNIHHDSIVLYEPNDSGGYEISLLFEDIFVRSSKRILGKNNGVLELDLEEILKKIKKKGIDFLIIVDFSCFDIDAGAGDRVRRYTDRNQPKNYGGKRKSRRSKRKSRKKRKRSKRKGKKKKNKTKTKKKRTKRLIK
jgi:hypothetical protein